MAQLVNEIPLDPRPQSFTIQLNGVEYKVTAKWNFYADVWVVDIDSTSEVPILLGVPLVAGADLLQQFEYLGFGGSLVVQSDSDPYQNAGFETLGLTDHLYFITQL